MYTCVETDGLTAAFASPLAQKGAICSVVAGFQTNHLFVFFGCTYKKMELFTIVQWSHFL